MSIAQLSKKKKVKVRSPQQKRSVDHKYVGAEPEFEIGTFLDGAHLSNVMNWYNYSKDGKDAIKYLREYFRDDEEICGKINGIKHPTTVQTSGWLARIISNGYEIPQKYRDRLKIRVVKEITKIKNEVEQPKRKINPQRGIMIKAGNIIAEVEGLIDDNELVSLYEYMVSNNFPTLYGAKVADFYRPILEEFEELIRGKNKDLIEGYNHLSKREITKRKNLYKMIVEDGDRFTTNKKPRKARTKKTISNSKIVKNLNYLKEYSKLKIISRPPEDIIGASQIWLVNTREKELIKVDANEGGFGVKGTTLQNINLDTSTKKRCRNKMDMVINEVLNGGKIKLRRVFDQINTKANTPTPRMNKNILILRIIK